MSFVDLDLRTGDHQLGPYRLVRPVSAGGMARVYEGRLDSLAGVSTRVAIKVIHPDFAADVGFQDLFVTEAQISARLDHPNLVRVQQFNREGDLLYLVMEYIEGFTLRKLISHARRSQIPVSTALIAEIGRQVCAGLHYAHTLTDENGEALHLVHRDIKPSNLMVNRQGAVKVLDFGISSARGGGETSTGNGVKGTWGYMSLEQAHGHAVGPGADMFGLGAVLYELCTGEPLFHERDNELIRSGLVHDEAARRAAANARPDLAPVLIRALQRDPAARFPSAAHFGRALGELVGDPLAAHEGLLAHANTLLQQNGSVQVGTQERARSESTINPAPANPARGNPARGNPARAHPARGNPARANAGLPIRVGDSHGPQLDRPPRVERKRARGIGWLLGGIAFGCAAAAIMVFAGWQLYRSSAAPVSERQALPPDLSALADPFPTVQPAAPQPLIKAEPQPAPIARPAPPARLAAPSPTAAAPTVQTAPAAPTAPATPQAAAAPKSSPNLSPAPATGFLSIGSEPAADVLIDGAFVKRTPLLRQQVSAGPHTIKLVPDSGDAKTFKVNVTGGQEARKIWNFKESTWVDE